MAINTNQISALLRPGLKAVFGQLPQYPEQWKEIFTTYQSDKYQEIDVEMKYLGAADIKEEGSPYAVDTMGQRTVTNYIHKRIGLSFTITKEAMEDNLYQTQFPQQAVSLRNSLRSTKNILAANVLNNAFNAAYPIGDGQPMCSVAHPIDGGTFSNRPDADVDLSLGALEEIVIQIQKTPMASGMLAQIMPKKLIVPPSQQFVASVLLNTKDKPSSANNDINAIYHSNYIPQGYTVNQYLDGKAWFVITDCPNGLKHFQRTPVETDTYVDFPTDNIMAKAGERYSFGVSDPRAIFGSPGA